MGKKVKEYPEKLVQRVNELYHDLFSERYHFAHPEIFEHDKDKWLNFARRFIVSDTPLTLVDVGTGTGFVPLTIARFLKEEDLFICSDISGDILEVARGNLAQERFRCRFDFVKLTGRVPFKLPFEEGVADVMTLNSVLHHVKDTQVFLGELDRVLKADGLVLIGHEPNGYFRTNKLFSGISYLINPRLAVDALAARFRLVGRLKNAVRSLLPGSRPDFAHHLGLTDRLNETLLAEKLIETPLLPEEVKEITDIRAREGFKPDRLLPGFDLLSLETCHHLFLPYDPRKNRILAGCEKFLKRAFPGSGAFFFAVYRKAKS
ncbi:MAG: class I SAM-dependent methyltransferase [Candidatus Glassbacteria bacterium]|nr:class I SAM-dependent methyltransferase [Candidatus Glassbacteria bacterium]